MGDTCKVIMDEDWAIGIRCGRKRVIGVYGKGNDSRRGYEEWVERVVQNMRTRDGMAIGDWNAHHESWSLDGGTNTNGRVLQEAIKDVGAKCIGTRGPTWERRVGGELLQSRIDLVFVKGLEMRGKIKRLKLASDHWGLLVEVEGDSEWSEVEREVIDWDSVDVTLGVGKKEEEKDLR